MRDDLTKKLEEAYPALFQRATKKRSHNNVYQHWGFQIGDGWYDLIEQMAKDILAIASDPAPTVLQVKEKFGTLRVYLDCRSCPEAETILAIVDAAQSKSASICEQCGAPGELRNDDGWLYTACAAHSQST